MTRELPSETVWAKDYFGDVRQWTLCRLRENRGLEYISLTRPVSDIIWETMIDQLKQFVRRRTFVFVLWLRLFIIVVALLFVRNRRLSFLCDN